jgi:hypothetical protein
MGQGPHSRCFSGALVAADQHAANTRINGVEQQGGLQLFLTDDGAKWIYGAFHWMPKTSDLQNLIKNNYYHTHKVCKAAPHRFPSNAGYSPLAYTDRRLAKILWSGISMAI